MEKALSVKWDKLKKLNEPNKLNKLFTLYELRLTKDLDLGFLVQYSVVTIRSWKIKKCKI